MLFSVASAQSLQQQYEQLNPTVRQQYDVVAQNVKPKLQPIETAVRTIALNDRSSLSARLEKLTEVQSQLNAWVGTSVIKYTVLLPLLNTVQAQREALAEAMPIRIPYSDTQIKAQLDITGAQNYALGLQQVPLVRGTVARGAFARTDKVIVYFKQGGPVVTSIKEIVSSPSDRTQTFLLADPIAVDRFLGGGALFIPQG